MSLRFHCLVHGIWLEVGPSLADVEQYLGEVVAITCDFGTEAHLASLPNIRLCDMLPWVQSYDGDGERLLEPPPPPFVAGVAPILRGMFKRAVLIPGLNHIAHNISGQISSKLEKYTWFLDRLKAIVYMLSHPGYNDRFRKTCLQDDPALRPLLAHVKRGVDPLIEWRWGSVVETAHGVESLKGALSYWDLQKYDFKNVDGDADDEVALAADNDGAGADDGGAAQQGKRRQRTALDTSLIGDAVKSTFWWAYLYMVMFLEDIMVAVRAFAMSCPCHRLRCTSKYMRS